MPKTTAPLPLIQIDDLVREMTPAEYARLLESGWTPEPTPKPTPEPPAE